MQWGRGQDKVQERETHTTTGEVLASSLELKEVFALGNTLLLTFTVEGREQVGMVGSIASNYLGNVTL